MELSTSVLNALKCLNGQQTQKVKLSNEQFNSLLKHVFDSFLVRPPSKGSKFDLELDVNKLGIFQLLNNFSQSKVAQFKHENLTTLKFK